MELIVGEDNKPHVMATEVGSKKSATPSTKNVGDRRRWHEFWKKKKASLSKHMNQKKGGPAEESIDSTDSDSGPNSSAVVVMNKNSHKNITVTAAGATAARHQESPLIGAVVSCDGEEELSHQESLYSSDDSSSFTASRYTDVDDKEPNMGTTILDDETRRQEEWMFFDDWAVSEQSDSASAGTEEEHATGFSIISESGSESSFGEDSDYESLSSASSTGVAGINPSLFFRGSTTEGKDTPVASWYDSLWAANGDDEGDDDSESACTGDGSTKGEISLDATSAASDIKSRVGEGGDDGSLLSAAPKFFAAADGKSSLLLPFDGHTSTVDPAPPAAASWYDALAAMYTTSQKKEKVCTQQDNVQEEEAHLKRNPHADAGAGIKFLHQSSRDERERIEMQMKEQANQQPGISDNTVSLEQFEQTSEKAHPSRSLSRWKKVSRRVMKVFRSANRMFKKLRREKNTSNTAVSGPLLGAVNVGLNTEDGGALLGATSVTDPASIDLPSFRDDQVEVLLELGAGVSPESLATLPSAEKLETPPAKDRISRLDADEEPSCSDEQVEVPLDSVNFAAWSEDPSFFDERGVEQVPLDRVEFPASTEDPSRFDEQVEVPLDRVHFAAWTEQDHPSFSAEQVEVPLDSLNLAAGTKEVSSSDEDGEAPLESKVRVSSGFFFVVMPPQATSLPAVTQTKAFINDSPAFECGEMSVLEAKGGGGAPESACEDERNTHSSVTASTTKAGDGVKQMTEEHGSLLNTHPARVATQTELTTNTSTSPSDWFDTLATMVMGEQRECIHCLELVRETSAQKRIYPYYADHDICDQYLHKKCHAERNAIERLKSTILRDYEALCSSLRVEKKKKRNASAKLVVSGNGKVAPRKRFWVSMMSREARVKTTKEEKKGEKGSNQTTNAATNKKILSSAKAPSSAVRHTHTGQLLRESNKNILVDNRQKKPPKKTTKLNGTMTKKKKASVVRDRPRHGSNSVEKLKYSIAKSQKQQMELATTTTTTTPSFSKKKKFRRHHHDHPKQDPVSSLLPPYQSREY